MNETIQTILNRRSVRQFTEEKIAKSDLELIVNCALHAPSAMKRDYWHFTVINNDELIKELVGIMQDLLCKPEYDMYKPQALIIPSTKRVYRLGVDDNACALENIFLAAKSLGIGSVWINQLRDFNDADALRAFLDKLMVPKDHIVYGIAALGYPKNDPSPIKREGTYNYFE